MSDRLSPLKYPDYAAHEVVIEMIKAGKISYAKDAMDVFTHVLDHYHAERKRVLAENTSR
ncbi:MULTISPECIES: hypothetical protein [Yersinia]|uniref:hypothetical protein n=1 Tax=Yersinia TaxID=629 RepID=UPI0005E9B7DA|nr:MULTISPECIES: hypothetical protein [Yersinia]CNI60265.1 Uncharacterised protein [Yersinia bercovieri]CNL10001.1 Uncharacterised protein [Yersinia frederiksenii]EKN3589036.1 hypothetical protein [Yersinia enterocolitica]EKN6195686.1 hypothetical protein [Yersinia enterocolitica]QKJ12213.1 hypothetical protein HRD68_16635 [Yersinia massiliensis]